ncbi:MAG: WD40 repeat domain-containing protein [bacterium]
MAIAQAGFVELRWMTPGSGSDLPDDQGAATLPKLLGELERPLLLPKIAPSRYGTTRLVFSADGRRLVWSNGGVAVWDVATRRELWRFVPPSTWNLPYWVWKNIYDVAFSPDGTVLATAGPRGVYLWDVA